MLDRLLSALESLPRSTRIWLVAHLFTLFGFVLLLGLFDGAGKSLANGGEQTLIDGLLALAGIPAALAIGRRRHAVWILVSVSVCACVAAAVIWHRTPFLAE